MLKEKLYKNKIRNTEEIIHQIKIMLDNGEKNTALTRHLSTQPCKIKNEPRKENYRNNISETKANVQDQSAINLSTTTLTEAKKSLLMKGPSFVSIP